MEANERAQWTPYNLAARASYLKRRIKDGGNVIGVVRGSGFPYDDTYQWQALTDPPQTGVSRGFYAAQRAVRRALREALRV